MRSKVLSNIGLLVGGTAIAQVITFVAMIYLTKLYSPTSFGLLAMVTSIVSLLLPMSTMRYDKAISLGEDVKEIKLMVFLSVAINLIFFFFLSLLSIIFWRLKLVQEENVIVIFVVPLGVFLFGIINIFQMYFEKLSRFKTTSSATLVDASTKAILQYIFHSIFIKTGMILGYLGALVVNTFYYLIKAKPLFHLSDFNIQKGDLKAVATKFIKFPKYFTWSNMLDSATQNICALTFPFFFSLGLLGNFSLAYKIVRLPALLVAMATRRTYYPKAAELYNVNKQAFFLLYKKTTLILVLISILPVIMFELFAKELFELLFDPDWSASVIYAKIILIYVFVNFCNSLAHENMIIFGLQKSFLFIEVFWFLLSIILIYIAYLYDNPYSAVVFFAISGIIMEILIFIAQYKNLMLKN